MRIYWLLFAMLSACAAEPLTGPDPVVPPATFSQVMAQAPQLSAPASGDAIDLGDCTYGTWQKALELGSAWALIHPTIEDRCEIWLGGETENPNYNGAPTQYCLFDRHGSIAITYGAGGPASIMSRFCGFFAMPG